MRTDVQMDRHDEVNSFFFCNFANVPKKKEMLMFNVPAFSMLSFVSLARVSIHRATSFDSVQLICCCAPQTENCLHTCAHFSKNQSLHNTSKHFKSYCSTVHFRRITSIYQPTNVHIISHKTLLKHFKTLRHVSILSDRHQGALFLAKVILQYLQFNSYLQTRCCGSISCCVVEQWLGVRRKTHT